jgi:hypothetical protein
MCLKWQVNIELFTSSHHNSHKKTEAIQVRSALKYKENKYIPIVTE